MHFVPMDERAPAASPRREPVGGHRHDRIEVTSCETSERPGTLHQGEQFVLAVGARSGFRDDLLRQDVERRILRDDRVQFAMANRPQQRRAFHEVVSRHREQAALRYADDRMAGPSDALKKRRDPVRRPDLTGQIDVPDVDAELERRRRNERFELPRLEPRLGIEPLFLRQAAVVRRDRVGANPVAQVTCETLGHPTRVDEHERRPVRLDQRREPVVVLLPHLVRHHRFERRSWDLQTEIDPSTMAFVDNPAIGHSGTVDRARADEKAGDFFDRFLRGGQTDPEHPGSSHLLEPLEAEREVRTAPRADHGVDFVDDHGADRPQHLPAALGRQQQVERLRRRDQNVGRRAQHCRALRLRRIARPDGCGYTRRVDPHLFREALETLARFGQILVNVRAQRLQGRHVDDAYLVRQGRAEPFLKKVVERRQKRRERLPRTGRRRDERVAAFTNRCPTAELRGRCRIERFRKPTRGDGMEVRERHLRGRSQNTANEMMITT